jgi:hypothetical protein
MGGHVSSGPLSAFEAGYVRWLVERGFRPGAVADRLGQFRALSRWLGARGLPVGELDPERVEEFLEARRAAGYRSYVAASSPAAGRGPRARGARIRLRSGPGPPRARARRTGTPVTSGAQGLNTISTRITSTTSSEA